MSVQKTPDGEKNLDNNKIRWEKDLKPFTRLPREKRPHTRQRIPAWIPLLVSFASIFPVCILSLSLMNRLRPAAKALTLATATTTYITPTATRFIPPTTTPYVVPTDTPPPPTTAADAGNTDNAGNTGNASTIVVGSKVRVSETGGTGLNFRDQPTIAGKLMRKLPEGGVFEVVGGPQEADGYIWWRLRDSSDGTLGWGAQNFMVPAQ
ncbi:MAG: hypothetical protein NTZ50_05715 [Chloroflexi bacterium]|nr:hypothetical protein [Chloroflexota bacterium]